LRGFAPLNRADRDPLHRSAARLTPPRAPAT